MTSFRPNDVAVRQPSLVLPLTLMAAFALFLSGCAGSARPSAATSLKVSGMVHGGQQPISGATLQLYAAGNGGDGTASTKLILTKITTSDGTGNASNSNANAGNTFNSLPTGAFTITNSYICPPAGAQVYLVATGGNPGLAAGTNNGSIALMAALGPCSALSNSTYVFLDELTTVGSVAALANYMTSYAAVGSGSADAAALQTAFAAVNEYTNTATGTVPGPTLPASYYASSVEIQTLADVIAACVNSGGGGIGDGTSCGSLFSNTTPLNGTVPTDTIGAALNIVLNPNQNVCAIYGLIPANPPYQSTLASCPSNWNLPIVQLSVSVSGVSSVYLGQTAQYSATVTNATNGQTSVTWQVNGVTGGSTANGTISNAGLYTPPTTPPSSAVTITAISALSATATGSTNVTVLPVTVAVSGPATVLFNQTGQYSAVVTGSTNQSVVWSVNGVTGGSSTEGTISTGGLYTAPASAPPTPVTIAAQSVAASSASGSVGITVSPTAVTYATGDSRTVTQPTNPAVCTTLYAQFTTSQRSSPPAAASDDTSRIQTALSSAACKNTGKSVELSVSGSNSAFFSELITATGDGLLIDSGVTLYGGATYSSGSELILLTGTNASLVGPGIVDGRGDLVTGTNTRLVQVSNFTNFIAYNVTLQQSIYPNLYIQSGTGATVWGVTILTPATRPNADGIDLDSLTNASVINSTIEAGDDGVAVKTNASAASNITVTGNKLYGTHGLSIGSQTFKGVSNVLFSNNYVYGTDLIGNVSANANGVNIKTDPTCGGTVQQVTYRNTCLSGVKHLIILNSAYGTCSGTAGTPNLNNIVVNGVYAKSSLSGAYSQFTGDATYPLNAYLAYISLDTASQSSSNLNAGISLDSSSLTPSGTGVTTSSFSTPGSIPTCSF